MKMGVAILLVWGLSAEGVRVDPQLIANVSLLLARFYTVDCVQIFRTENFSLSRLEAIHATWKRLTKVDSKLTTGIYTYEGYLEKKTVKPKKVSCYRSLKIMSDDSHSMKGYAKFSMKFSLKDAIWVLYTDSPSVSFFEDAHIVFDDVIIIAIIQSEDIVLFREVYRVADGFPLRFFPLGNWTREGGLNIVEESIYARRSDLEGFVLRTASVENWPATYYKNGRWQGFLIDLWKEIEVLINCTSVDVQAEDFVGIKMENGSWNGVVGMALRKEIDVIVTEIVIDKERSHALDFFHPIIKSRFQIYTKHLGYGWQWGSALKPFHVNVWMTAMSWVAVATLVWTFLHRACASRRLGSMDFEKFVPLKSFFFVTQALCQQGSHFVPDSYACRILFFVSYAVSSVLIPSYSASLVSFLSQKEQLKTFDSLQDMVADGTYRLLVKENTAQYAFFKHSKSDFFKLAHEKLVKSVPSRMRQLDAIDSLKVLCHLDKYAFMGVEDIVEERLHHMGSLDCPVVHLTYPVSPVYLTMATAKHHPFWGLINYHLGKLLNSGIAERLRRAEFPPKDGSIFRVKGSEGGVGMRQLISAFVFIGFFGVVSVLVLLLEIQHSWQVAQKKRRRRKKRGLYPGQSKVPPQYEMRLYRTRPRPDFYSN